MMSPIDHAMRLAEDGFRVFPLLEKTKLPAIKNWQMLATDRWSRIDRWWSRNPHYNIGIVTEWFCALDPDVKGGIDGHRSLANRLQELGLPRRPQTRGHHTPSGGMHFLYQVRGDQEVRNSASSLAPGVDVRGLGGYIVGPGSRINGRTYEVAPGFDLPVAPLPPALFEALRTHERRRLLGREPSSTSGTYDLDREQELVQGLRPGHRNQELFRVSCRVGALIGQGRLTDPDRAFLDLYAAAITITDETFTDEEAESVIPQHQTGDQRQPVREVRSAHLALAWHGLRWSTVTTPARRLRKAHHILELARVETDNQELRRHLANLRDDIAILLTDVEDGHYLTSLE